MQKGVGTMGYSRYLFLVNLVIISLIIAGCATTPEEPPPKQMQGVFFPKPPELPRIQYLRSYTSNKDIETEVSKFEKFITGEQERIKRLDKPFGVAIHDGRIYVCDSNFSVMVFDLKEKKFHRLEGARGMGKAVQPINIKIDSDGTKYVADPVRGQVLVYDSNDFFLKAIGNQMQWTPIDVAVFGEFLYVVDKSSNEIWILDKNSGEVVDRIGKKSEDVKEHLFRPTNIIFSPKGDMYVSDPGRFQVVRLDRDGHFLGSIGKLGASPGHFSRPKGIATDREGRVYVVDSAFDNVQIFTPDGRLLMFFGRPGNYAGDFNLPAAITVDYENVEYFSEYIDPNFEAEALLIVTNQFGARLVNIFALGKQKGVDYPSDEELLQALEKLKRELEEKEKKRETGTE
jgi:DNA-binding beta-propeller fold protein YncE